MVGNYQTNKSALNQQRFSNSTICIFTATSRRNYSIYRQYFISLEVQEVEGVEGWMCMGSRCAPSRKILIFPQKCYIFTARRKASFASAVYATAYPSVCPSVRPSVTLRYCFKMRERKGMRSSPSGSAVSSFLTPRMVDG